MKNTHVPRKIPERFAAAVLLRVETLLMLKYGREQAGVCYGDFTVRLDHAMHRTEIPEYGGRENMQRAFVRQNYPVNFVVGFRGERIGISWNEAYPRLDSLAGGSLIDAMARRIVTIAHERLQPGYMPF